jgi:hypothetical protein
MQIDPDVDLWNLGRRDRMSTVSLSVFTEPTRRVAHIHDLSLVGTCIIEARHTALNYESANGNPWGVSRRIVAVLAFSPVKIDCSPDLDTPFLQIL